MTHDKQSKTAEHLFRDCPYFFGAFQHVPWMYGSFNVAFNYIVKLVKISKYEGR